MVGDSSVTTFFLVRHATVDAIGSSIAGWTSGVHLNGVGHLQARQLSATLGSQRVAAIYSSPLERAQETAGYISARLGLRVQLLDSIGEIRYGDWTGHDLEELASDEKWQAYNSFRSGVRIPGGELMLEVQTRIVLELERLRKQHPAQAVILVSHGDLIRAAIAYVAGIPLDLLQRIEVSPASISSLVLDDHFARILCLNITPDYGEPRESMEP